MYAVFPHRQFGEIQKGFDKARAAADLFEAAGEHDGWIETIGLYGGTLRDSGRGEEALTQHQRIVAFLDAPDCPLSGHAAGTYRVAAAEALGLDYAALGRWREAAEHYRQAVAQANRVGIPHKEAEGLLHLGEALIELGETEEARASLHQALAFGETADRQELAAVQKLLDMLPAE